MESGSYSKLPNSDNGENQPSVPSHAKVEPRPGRLRRSSEVIRRPRAPQTVKVCYCYAREDKSLCDELDKHLSALKYSDGRVPPRITTWSDSEILAGTEWEHEINDRLGTANLILLLISSSFLGSDYCKREMQQAFERHKAGTAQVIPIILRPVLWEGTPTIGELQLLPTNATPVTLWPDRDLAFKDVAQAISLVVANIRSQLEREAERQQLIRELQSQVEGLINEAHARRSKIESLSTEISRGTDEKNSLQFKLAEIQRQLALLETQTRQLQAELDSTYTAEYESQQKYKRLVDQLSTLEQLPEWLLKLKPFFEYPEILCPSCGAKMLLGNGACSSCGWRYPGQNPLADSLIL